MLSRENPSLLLPASGDCWQSLEFLSLQLHHCNLCLHMASSLCVSVFTPLSPLHPFCICVQIFPLLLSKLVTGSGPPNPALPHFPLVTSAKTPFPNKFAFTRFHPVQSSTQFSPEGSGTFQESELLEYRSEDFLISCISFQAYWVLSGTMWAWGLFITPNLGRSHRH